MIIAGKAELEALLKSYLMGSREISSEDYTNSEAEVRMYAYLNLFSAVSDGETYVVSNTKVRRGNQNAVYGRNLIFALKNKEIILTEDYTLKTRRLTDFGKELLLVWREHNKLDLQKGTSLEDIT